MENKIVNTLKRLCSEGHLDEKLCDLLTPRYSSAPKMYGLPKVHKEGTHMRPIVSAIGFLSYNLAKELARILTPLAGHTPHSEELLSICEQNQKHGDGTTRPTNQL